MLSIFPRGVLDEILNLIESVSEGFPSYSLILSNHQEGSVQSINNYPFSNDFTVDNIMARADEGYDRQQTAFRLNLEFGLIVVNTDSGEYRYFTPYSNAELFQRPIYVSRRQD